MSDQKHGIADLEICASDVIDGTHLKTVMEVTAPAALAGRKILTNFDLRSAQEQFFALCRAIGVVDAEDSKELHCKRFRAAVSGGRIERYYFPDAGVAV